MKYIEVVDVIYPKNKERIGFIKIHGGKLIFVPIDHKYGDMILRDVKKELFEEIKEESELLGFSYVKGSRIN
jgi:hypothetical protein